MNMLIMIAGLTLVKKFIKLVSGFVGGADAFETGKSVAEDVKSTGMKAAGMAMKGAAVGVGIGKVGFAAMKGVGRGAGWIGRKIGNTKVGGAIKKGLGSVGGAIGGAARWAGSKLKGIGNGIGNLKNSDKRVVRGIGHVLTAVPTFAKFAQKSVKDAKQGQGWLGKLVTTKEKVKVPVYEKDAEGKIKKDENGNPIVQKDKEGNTVEQEVEQTVLKPGLKAFGQGLLDISGSSVKLVGDITGLSKFFKDLGETGVVDDAKTAVQKFGQGIGMFKGGIPDQLKTKKQKEDDEKKALEAQRDAQRDIRTNSEKTLKAIQDLVALMGKKK